MDIKAKCLELIKLIVEQQKTIVQIYITLYGEKAEITQNALTRLGKYTLAMESYKEREKANV